MFSKDYKAYKLAINTNDFADTSKDIFTWGVDINNCSLPIHLCEKINRGVKILGGPWRVLIPQPKNSFFVFNINALKIFLYEYCDFTFDELSELNNYYKLYEVRYTCISNGISKFRGTVFNDEIEDIIEIPLNSISNDFISTFDSIALTGDVNMCKAHYYNKINFKTIF